MRERGGRNIADSERVTGEKAVFRQPRLKHGIRLCPQVSRGRDTVMVALRLWACGSGPERPEHVDPRASRGPSPSISTRWRDFRASSGQMVVPDPCVSARYLTMELDSQSMKPSSSMVGNDSVWDSGRDIPADHCRRRARRYQPVRKEYSVLRRSRQLSARWTRSLVPVSSACSLQLFVVGGLWSGRGDSR